MYIFDYLCKESELIKKILDVPNVVCGPPCSVKRQLALIVDGVGRGDQCCPHGLRKTVCGKSQWIQSFRPEAILQLPVVTNPRNIPTPSDTAHPISPAGHRSAPAP